MIELRDYQHFAVNKLRANIASGLNNQTLCLGTGSGKTVVASYLVDECQKKGKRAVFVVDRISLIDQTSAMLDFYGIEHGVIQAQHWRFKPWERIQVASIQTLQRRQWPEADLIVVDECHGLHKATLERIGKRDTVVIGLSATPFTKGMGKHYDAVVSGITTHRLIEQNHLVPFRVFAASEPDMTGAKITAGEWTDHEAAERSMPIVGDCVYEYIKHGLGKKFLAFGANVAHCEELQRQFMAAGIITELYTYRTGDDVRAEMVREFRKPDSRINGLVSVAALSKGFDVPDVGVIIMARPLRSSLAEHIQILGRGLRIHPGKQECLILDHSGNCLRFWDRMQDFFENGIDELDDGKPKNKADAKPKERQAIKCPDCKHVHDASPSCPCCGHEYPRKKSNILHAPGSLKELIATGSRTALSASIWPQIVGLAHENGIRSEWDEDRRRKWALAQFKQLTGSFPTQDFSATDPVSPSTDVRNKIKSQYIRWQRGQKSANRMAA